MDGKHGSGTCSPSSHPESTAKCATESDDEETRGGRKQQMKRSSDMVFTKPVKTMDASLSSMLHLQGVTEPILGLRYVWEYRSPNKSVPPHYECKLCAVSRSQSDMVDHIKGWKHCFKYLKKVYPNTITYVYEELEVAQKDSAIRKSIREFAAEVEQSEGRGELKIVFNKGTSIKSFSLFSMLQGVTEPIIGLQHVWEYRSPTKSVPPHYQCKLCAVSCLQSDMVDHIKDWKHAFKYLKLVRPNMITCEEEDAQNDHDIMKSITELAEEVENSEGKGHVKIIVKEPCDVPAFQGPQFSFPTMKPSMGGMGQNGPRSGGRLPGEFKTGRRREPGFGGYAARPDVPNPDMAQRQFPDGMGHHHGGGDGFGRDGRRDDFGMSGRQVDGPGRRYPDDIQMGSRLLDRPGSMEVADPDSNSILATLLKYLNTFRIENESDAQIVLKVLKKLTDVLMDYRLRSVDTVPSVSSSLNSSLGYSLPPSRMPGAADHYSGGPSGPSRYSDAHQGSTTEIV